MEEKINQVYKFSFCLFLFLLFFLNDYVLKLSGVSLLV